MKLFHIGLCVQQWPYNGFQKAFIDVLGEENYRELSCGHKNLNFEAIRIFNEFKPDIVFLQIQTPSIIDNHTVSYFNTNGARVINFTGDVRSPTPKWMVSMASYIYCTAFTNMVDVKILRAKGAKSEYLEIGYDPEIYKPEGEKAKVPEIVFMANNYGASSFPLSQYRIELVKKLRDSFNGNFGLYGNGWTGTNGNVNTSQPEEAKHYRGAKIAINCSHFNYERYSSDRLLRILGTGTFCLTHNYTGIGKDYENGKHLVIFKDLEDLEDKIIYYLKHEEEREQIAKAGQELVSNRNTFKHQVLEILKL